MFPLKNLAVLPEWLTESICRRNAFELIPEPVINFSIDNRDLFGTRLQMPPKTQICERKNISQYLYLVFCELNGSSFYKVGLTTHKDPIRRDPKVYKHVIFSHKVDYSWAHIYEHYCLWRCKQIRGKQPWNLVAFGGWAGKTEMIRSTDRSVEAIFAQAYNEIKIASTRLNHNQVLFEWYLHDSLIKSVYDERFTSSAITVYSIACKIVRHFRELHGDPEDGVYIELHPVAGNFLAKRLVQQLAPVVDQKWSQLNIRSPLERYHMGKRLYEQWCLDTWGETCWSHAKPYRNMAVWNSLEDPSVRELAKIYRESIYKIFEKRASAHKLPKRLLALKQPRLPDAEAE